MSIKIGNKFSKKRYSLKERLFRILTKLVKWLIGRIPARINFELLSRLRMTMQERNLLRTTVSKPDNINLSLCSLVVGELIPVEDIEALRIGLKKLLRMYHGISISSPSGKDPVDDFCNTVTTDIGARRWQNFGRIKPPTQDKLDDWISFIDVAAIQSSSSFIVLQFNIYPAKGFLSEFDTLINNDISDELTFTPSLKYLFRFWASGSEVNSQVKARKIRDLLTELQCRFLSRIRHMVRGYLFTNDILAPVFELYTLNNEGEPSLSVNPNNWRDLFWQSVRMEKDSSSYYLSEDKAWGAFLDEDPPGFYKSLIFLAHNVKGSDDNYKEIILPVNEYAKVILPILVMDKCVDFFEKILGAYRIQLLKLTRHRRLDYRKLLKLRLGLERDSQFVRRFIDEIDSSHHTFLAARAAHVFGPLTNALRSSPHKNLEFSAMIINNTVGRIHRVEKLRNHIVKIIDDVISMKQIILGNFYTKAALILMLVTLFATAVSIVVPLHLHPKPLQQEFYRHISNMKIWRYISRAN